jgi:adenosine/AMP kinase
VKAAVLDDLDWPEDALATIVGIANAQAVFTADDLRREMRPAPNGNMYGAAFAAARNLHLIEAIGDQASTSKSRKYGRLRQWTRHTNKGVES